MTSTRKRRSFMAEMLIWILLIVVVPVIVLQVYSYYNNLDHLKSLEQEKSRSTNRSAQLAIENMGEAILGITITNSYWEDNRLAVENGDLAWLNENVADLPEIVDSIDFVAETDLKGRVLVSSGGVRELEGTLAYPVILERFAKDKEFYGILNTSKGLAVVAVSAVTDEQGTRPPNAMMITGRLISENMIQKLSDMLQTEVAVLSENGQYLRSNGGLDKIGLEELLSGSEDGREIFRMDLVDGTYVPQYAAPLKDMSGQEIGVIHTQYPSESATQAVDVQGRRMILTVVLLAVLLALVMFLLRRRIVLPLRHFTNTLEEVAAGKQIDQIPDHVMQAEAGIVQAIQQVMHWNHLLEQTVDRRTSEIRNLLDHARQGFLSFGPDFIVKEEYSLECVRLFGREPAGHSLPDLLYGDDPAENGLLRSILTDYFNEKDPNSKELIFSLLPEEVRLGSRPAKVEFIPIREDKPGGNETLMAIFTDLTETRRLEDMMQQERRVLRMVVQIVTHPEDFAHIVRDFESFCRTEMWETLAAGGSSKEKAESIYRSAHTFKGSFAFLNFLHIVPKLHELESGLQERMNSDSPDLEELTQYLREQNPDDWMEEDLELLRSVLGASYDSLLKDEGVKLDRSQWADIERRLERTLTEPEDRAWLDEFRKWRYRPVGHLFKPYSSYLTELAERNGVLLYPVELQGGEIPVDPDRLYGFARSFVHVVRNVVVHGIEPPDERVASGKDEFGTVSFIVEQMEGGIRITFGDDGRGIDPDKLKAKAAQQGMDTDDLTDEEALQLIFEERLSTSRQVTEWSGRGVGLSVVKDEVAQLGGKISIRTRIGSGTSFVFDLPVKDSSRGEDRIGA